MKDYELVVVYHPDLEIDLDKALKKVEGLVDGVKGKVLFSENWGKRRLAYQIKKQEYAIYVYYEVQLPDGAVRTLESQLNITDEVIRYLITKPTPNFGDREKKMLNDDYDESSAEDEEATGKDSKVKKGVKSKPKEDTEKEQVDKKTAKKKQTNDKSSSDDEEK